ncbi:amino acid ABC transporter substrate-binding protein, PAAT family [Pseudomonas anguilliseptica]|uniref:Amino acid ABC transporter substrate-binding protein, PAAT family n=1 Tax=Pseudomonas anguilliseptica TaxID=53406 RepID=A0A1H4Z1R3_PSEAG|nr:amino acid ABC transporter substrate-binding protein, PAAT family [Pseudomonas anguilliseptica]
MCSSFLRRLSLACCCVLLIAPLAARELLAVGSNFPGVFEQHGSGHSGLATSVLRQTLEPLGYQVRFELHPWARAQHMVARGEGDILIGPYKNAAREQLFAFSARPFYRDHIVFYCQRGSVLRWRGDYQQLLGRRIGVVRAWAYGAHFDSRREQLELVTVERVENGLKMLVAGRLDLLASNQRNTQPELLALGLADKLEQLATPIDLQDGYFAFPRDERYRPLREEFDRALQQMIEQGRLAQLAADWQVEIP